MNLKVQISIFYIKLKLELRFKKYNVVSDLDNNLYRY